MPRATPYWRAIVDDIRAQIADGRLKPRQKLPTTAELVDHYGYLSPEGRIAPATVRDAITRLINDGTLIGHQGVGVYVALTPDVPDS